MEIIGYVASIFIGLVLGIMGGGGSILTVPVLVYLFGFDAVAATAYSLFIVGGTSIVGSLSYLKKGQLDFTKVVAFGIPSVIAVFLTRSFVVPAIPDHIFTIGNFVLTKNLLLILLFALVMILASYSMIRGRKKITDSAKSMDYTSIAFQGALIGFVAAMVGAGGGFLMIPVLVNVLNVPMKKAVGTSLVIISINSLLGFVFSLPHISVEWSFLMSVAAIAIFGIIIGSYISTKIDGKKLKPLFGYFILIMGLYIIIKELFM